MMPNLCLDTFRRNTSAVEKEGPVDSLSALKGCLVIVF
jgi:hypothetical protein